MSEPESSITGDGKASQAQLENRVGRLEAHVGHLAEAIEATNDHIKTQGKQQAEGFAELRKALSAVADRNDRNTQELNDRITQVSENELKRGQWSLPVVISAIILLLTMGAGMMQFVRMSVSPVVDALATQSATLKRHMDKPGHDETLIKSAESEVRIDMIEKRIDTLERIQLNPLTGRRHNDIN